MLISFAETLQFFIFIFQLSPAKTQGLLNEPALFFCENYFVFVRSVEARKAKNVHMLLNSRHSPKIAFIEIQFTKVKALYSSCVYSDFHHFQIGSSKRSWIRPSFFAVALRLKGLLKFVCFLFSNGRPSIVLNQYVSSNRLRIEIGSCKFQSPISLGWNLVIEFCDRKAAKNFNRFILLYFLESATTTNVIPLVTDFFWEKKRIKSVCRTSGSNSSINLQSKKQQFQRLL